MRVARTRLTIAVVLLASVLLPSAAFAQTPAVPSHDWSGLQSVASGSKLITN
jgi:hypothetical protein